MSVPSMSKRRPAAVVEDAMVRVRVNLAGIGREWVGQGFEGMIRMNVCELHRICRLSLLDVTE